MFEYFYPITWLLGCRHGVGGKLDLGRARLFPGWYDRESEENGR